MKDEWINQLAQGLGTSRKPRSSQYLLGLMLLASTLSGLIFLYGGGFRLDLGQALERTDFRVELALLFGLSLTAYGMAEKTSIPGRANAPQRILFGLLTTLVILFGMFYLHPDLPGPAHFTEGWHCLVLIICNAFVPWLITWKLIRTHTAPTRPELTMAFIMLGSLGAAVGVQHFICPFNESMHLMVWHLTVLPAAALVARVLGPKMLRW